MYADDMKLARRIRSTDDAVALQKDLDILSALSAVWKLKLTRQSARSLLSLCAKSLS